MVIFIKLDGDACRVSRVPLLPEGHCWVNTSPDGERPQVLKESPKNAAWHEQNDRNALEAQIRRQQ
jgi:hypothetical protein